MFRTLLRRAVERRPIQLLTTVDQCRNVTERLLSSGIDRIGIDCEGTRIGRFGSFGLIQLATEKEVFLVDVVVGGTRVVESLAPLFENRDLVKVVHDCREDASALLNQYGIPLASVFDTQVGHIAWLESKNLPPYQASIGEVLRTFLLKAYRAHRWDELERKPIPAQSWHSRPLEPSSVRYAVEGVVHLPALHRAICRELGDPGGDLVVRRSTRYIEYSKMNRTELPVSHVAVFKPGLPLMGMLASRREDAAYFKLNYAPITGAVLDSTDLRDFIDLQPGDIVACRVKSVSECKNFIHLQREGHGNLFYDQQLRQVRMLPSMEEVNRRHPVRDSSFYGMGESFGGKPPLEEEPGSFRDKKPEVFFVARGKTKIRKSGFKPPKRQADRHGDFHRPGKAIHKEFSGRSIKQ